MFDHLHALKYSDYRVYGTIVCIWNASRNVYTNSMVLHQV